MTKEKTTVSPVNNLEGLAKAIQQTNQLFLNQVQKQVNTALTLRNWAIGYHIFEYEQQGEDRAQYGEELFKKLVERLKMLEIRGFSFTSLYLCRQFYLTYPQVAQLAADYIQVDDYQLNRILQSLTEEFEQLPVTPTNALINKLSFTHFVASCLLSPHTEMSHSAGFETGRFHSCRCGANERLS